MWWCADSENCCKMAPLRLTKVASNRIMAFEDEFMPEKNRNLFFFQIPAEVCIPSIGPRPTAMWYGIRDTFHMWWCANSEFYLKMAPRGLPKVASNSFLIFWDEIIPNKIEFYSFSTFLPRYVFHRLGPGPQLIDKASDTRFICGGVPIPNFA